jgi:hypothetical protein
MKRVIMLKIDENLIEIFLTHPTVHNNLSLVSNINISSFEYFMMAGEFYLLE